MRSYEGVARCKDEWTELLLTLIPKVWVESPDPSHTIPRPILECGNSPYQDPMAWLCVYMYEGALV